MASIHRKSDSGPQGIQVSQHPFLKSRHKRESPSPCAHHWVLLAKIACLQQSIISWPFIEGIPCPQYRTKVLFTYYVKEASKTVLWDWGIAQWWSPALEERPLTPSQGSEVDLMGKRHPSSYSGNCSPTFSRGGGHTTRHSPFSRSEDTSLNPELACHSC